jgi:hypothetical protein
MKFNVEDIATYKRVVAAVASLTSSKINSPIEQCVKVEATKRGVTLTALESDSHCMSVTVPAMVQEEGVVYILGSKLNGMTKKLTPKAVLAVTLANNNLIYKLPILGAISESIFHDQAGFKQSIVTLKDNEFTDLLGGSDLLPSLLRSICSSVFANKNVLMKTDVNKVFMYSQFSETGYIKYVLPAICGEQCAIYLSPNLLRMASSLGEELDVYYNKANKVLRFKCDDSVLTVKGDTLDSKSHIVVDSLLDLAPVGEAVVNHADLTSALNWQSYGAGVGQGVELDVKDGNLIVRSNKTDNPASIGCDQDVGFQAINVPLVSLVTALKAIGNSKNAVLMVNSVSLEERVHKVGDMEIKLLSISPADDVDTLGRALIYEQVRSSNK